MLVPLIMPFQFEGSWVLLLLRLARAPWWVLALVLRPVLESCVANMQKMTSSRCCGFQGKPVFLGGVSLFEVGCVLKPPKVWGLAAVGFFQGRPVSFVSAQFSLFGMLA